MKTNPKPILVYAWVSRAQGTVEAKACVWSREATARRAMELAEHAEREAEGRSWSGGLLLQDTHDVLSRARAMALERESDLYVKGPVKQALT